MIDSDLPFYVWRMAITLTKRATDRTLFSTDLLSMALGISAQCTGGRVEPKPRAE